MVIAVTIVVVVTVSAIGVTVTIVIVAAAVIALTVVSRIQVANVASLRAALIVIGLIVAIAPRWRWGIMLSAIFNDRRWRVVGSADGRRWRVVGAVDGSRRRVVGAVEAEDYP